MTFCKKHFVQTCRIIIRVEQTHGKYCVRAETLESPIQGLKKIIWDNDADIHHLADKYSIKGLHKQLHNHNIPRKMFKIPNIKYLTA